MIKMFSLDSEISTHDFVIIAWDTRTINAAGLKSVIFGCLKISAKDKSRPKQTDAILARLRTNILLTECLLLFVS